MGTTGRFLRILLAGLAVSVLAACSGEDEEAPRRSNDATATTSVDAESVAATELVTGDCLVGIGIGRQETIKVESVAVVDCDGHHDLEVFEVFELTPEMVSADDLSVYPGRGRVGNAAEVGCNNALEEVGIDTEVLGAISVWPSRDSWQTGDHTVVCAIYLQDGRQFDGRQLELQAPETDD